MTDYHSILSRAVASLESNTAQARAALYERARGLLIDRIESDRDRWTEESALAEIAHFDAATDRIESDIARRTTNDSIGRYRQPRAGQAPAPEHDVPPDRPGRNIGRIVTLGAVGLLGLGLIGLAVYAFQGQQPTAAKAPGKSTVATAPEAVKKAAYRVRRLMATTWSLASTADRPTPAFLITCGARRSITGASIQPA